MRNSQAGWARMFERILVTMGLSPITWSAIPYVRQLAISFSSELHLMGLTVEPRKVWDNSLKAYIESVAKGLEEENIVTKTSFVNGNPAVEVVKYCDRNDIKLVATLTGSASGIDCTLISNIAKKMGKSLNIPILMVSSRRARGIDIAEKIIFRKILVPLDCSQTSEIVLPYVEAIAKKMDSTIILLHVNEPPFRGVPIIHNEVIKMSRKVGEVYIKIICADILSRGINARCEVIDGSRVKTILKYSGQDRIDLIAMANRNSSGVTGWIFGNTTTSITKRSALPILVVGYPEYEPQMI
jgi:nucleotide-binding universal stress UspA family protein